MTNMFVSNLDKKGIAENGKFLEYITVNQNIIVTVKSRVTYFKCYSVASIKSTCKVKIPNNPNLLSNYI